MCIGSICIVFTAISSLSGCFSVNGVNCICLAGTIILATTGISVSIFLFAGKEYCNYYNYQENILDMLCFLNYYALKNL